MGQELTATADLCDSLGAAAQVIALAWRDYGLLRSFHGPAQTIAAQQDNSLVRAALETPGKGRVLVIDNDGRGDCAMVGGNLGHLARANGWAGIIVNGMVRDWEELIHEEIGIKALGTCPRRSEKRGRGLTGVELGFGGARIRPGDAIYADWDGVVVVAAADAADSRQG